MKLFITGATGFVGRQVVHTALARGHDVLALARPTADVASFRQPPAHGHQGALDIVRHDLRQPRGLDDTLQGVDAVLHLAAAKTGSFYAQMAGTVVATENLLTSMRKAGVGRLVLVSSFAVYDYLAVRCHGTLNEASPLEPEPEQRDDYCRTKLLQERLGREAETAGDVRLTVLRPGVIYGEPDHLWTDRLGVRVGRTWWATGSRARLPLTHVRNCAEAIVLAGERDAAIGQTLNIVDDHLPTQGQYGRALRRALRGSGAAPARVVPLNWTLMRCGVWGLDAINRRLLHGRARLPAILRRRALHARCRPLRYSNQRAREVLHWTPTLHWRQAFATLARAADPHSPSRKASVSEAAVPDAV